jgi:hypothetical protein
MLIQVSCMKEINITIPDQDKKIVMNGFLTPDSLFQINLTKSKSVNENDDIIPFIDSGTVTVYNNGILSETLVPSGNGNYISVSKKPLTGESYHLEATVNGMKTVFSDASIPPYIPILSIDTTYVSDSTNNFGYITENKYYRTNFKFTDPISENYYLINFTVEYYDSIYDNYPTVYWGKRIVPYQVSDEGSFMSIGQRSDIMYVNEGVLFSDVLFNGKTNEITFNLRIGDIYYSTYVNSITLYFNFFSITKDYYLYLSSKYKYINTEHNVFAEPVPVYSNITNGIGILAAGSKSTDSLIIPKNVLQKFIYQNPEYPGDTIKIPPR